MRTAMNNQDEVFPLKMGQRWYLTTVIGSIPFYSSPSWETEEEAKAQLVQLAETSALKPERSGFESPAGHQFTPAEAEQLKSCLACGFDNNVVDQYTWDHLRTKLVDIIKGKIPPSPTHS